MIFLNYKEISHKATRMLLTVGIIVFFSGAANSQSSSESWTLKKCLEHAHAYNLNVQKVKLSVESARWNYRQSIGDLFPTVGGSFSHSFNFGLRFDQTSGQLFDQRFQSAFAGISFQYPIFNGLSNYYRVSQNKYSLKAAGADYSQALDDLSLNIIDLFMQVLFARERLEILKQQVDVLQQQVERTDLLYNAGNVTRGDLLNIQSQLAQQEIAYVNGENALIAAKIGLIQALNLTQEDIVIQMPNLDSIPIEDISSEESVQSIYNTAVGIRPGILSSQLRMKSARQALASARGNYYPSISLNASVGTNFSELRKENPFDPLSPTIPYFTQFHQNNNQQISFSLNVPIFNGLSIRNSVQQARISFLSSEVDLSIQQQNLRNTIQQAYADAKAAYKTFQANSRNLEALEEAFMYADEKARAGAINFVEYNDAQTRFFNAKTELLIARFDYIFKTKVLDFYKGKPLNLE